MATIRALALDVLVRDELVHQYAEDRGWTPPASYRKAVDGIDDQVEQFNIAPGDVDTFRKVREAEEYASWVYAKAGEEKLGAGADPQAALDEGRKILTDVRRRRRRHPRPALRHRVAGRGSTFPSTGGLSVPVTTLAKGGAHPADPQSGDTSYVDSLPADQKCG